MVGKRIGLIRVLTTDDADLLASHGNHIMARLRGLRVVTRCIPDQPEGVHDAPTEAAAGPKVVRLAREMAAEGLAAVIISCVADPGLDEARRVIRVPVIGAGQSAGLLCLGLGGTVGAVGITEQVPAAMAAVLGGSLVAVIKPRGVRTTLDLLLPEGRVAALEAAVSLKHRGVDAIVLSCTGMSTIGMADAIRSEVGLRVVDPVIAAGLFAWYAVTDS